jgi:hypothetical protein
MIAANALTGPASSLPVCSCDEFSSGHLRQNRDTLVMSAKRIHDLDRASFPIIGSALDQAVGFPVKGWICVFPFRSFI